MPAYFDFGSQAQDPLKPAGVFDRLIAELPGEGPKPERLMIDALPKASSLLGANC